MIAAPAKPTYREAVAFWIRLGFISFGGPAGQIAIMHTFLVDQKRWISDSRFLHALNYCMLLPGPEAQQLATYIGWLLHGRLGGLAAGALFVLPSMFILLGLSVVYVTFGELPWVAALFNGLKPAVIAIVITALVKIARRSLLSAIHWLIALGAFACIFFFAVPFPLIILGALLFSIAIRVWAPKFLTAGKKSDGKAIADEDSFYLNSNGPLIGDAFRCSRLVRPVLIATAIWCVPYLLLQQFGADPGFWRTLSLFFTQAAFVTFGGAYAVLPYVAQVSVEQLHWLSGPQMLDGLALGETTPGPLIMVLAFVGFMAGHNHFGGSIAFGCVGLFATVLYTFLPSFLFIFGGAPIIERTRGNMKLQAVLSLVTAAVVGVVLDLTIYLAITVLFPGSRSFANVDVPALLWAVLSFVMLQQFKVNMMVWLGLSALFGLAIHLIE